MSASQPPADQPGNVPPVQPPTTQPGAVPVGNQPYPPAQVPPAPKKKGMGSKILSVLVAIAVLIGIRVAFTMLGQKTEANEITKLAGKCITVTGSGKDLDHKVVDCAADGMSYIVASTHEGSTAACPENMLEYYKEAGTGGKTLARACLIPNFRENVCYGPEANGAMKIVTCTDPQAYFKISKRIEGVADKTKCGEDEALVYTDPKYTFCQVAAG